MKTFQYRWKINNQEFTGTKNFESREALKEHLSRIGGELIEILTEVEKPTPPPAKIIKPEVPPEKTAAINVSGTETLDRGKISPVLDQRTGSGMKEENLFQGEFTQIGKLWKRAVAYIADCSILLLPSLIISFGYFSVVLGGNFEDILKISELEQMKAAIPLQFILWAVYLSYFTYFIGKSGYTPGKKSMGLKVVNSDGKVIGYGKAYIRYLILSIYNLGTIGGVIFIISAVMAIADKRRRTLHDRFCKTIVVSTGTEPAIEKIRQEGKQRISGPAIFGLILSIFCIVIPIAGQLICFYVCGRVLSDIKQSKGLLKGKTFAIAGIVISALVLIAYVIVFSMMPHSKWSNQ
jgi:uncharacterized RDD family membrane protein YckC